MRQAEASPEAVAFSQGLNGEGYLQNIRTTSKVGVAYVVYPFRANENVACLLVNGSPPLIDVDRLEALPQNQMKTDATYRALATSKPNMTLWPGVRDDASNPVTVRTLAGNGQRFVIHYFLQDGCHACARIGQATYGFDFDESGRFLGIRFLGVERIANPEK
jgi:hypothetical protein